MYLVKNMIVSFRFWLEYQSRALQEVGSDFGPHNVGVGIKLDFNISAKARTVVVSSRLCIPKRFHDGIGSYKTHTYLSATRAVSFF